MLNEDIMKYWNGIEQKPIHVFRLFGLTLSIAEYVLGWYRSRTPLTQSMFIYIQ